MSRSLKLKNNDYIDSKGITHNRKLLSDVLGKILYDDSNGSNTTITLNDSVSNYDYIEIFFRIEGPFSSIKVYSPHNKEISLGGSYDFDDYSYSKNSRWKCENNKITYLASNQYYIHSGIIGGWSEGLNAVRILRVMGYK